jgi:hypothetical protein
LPAAPAPGRQLRKESISLQTNTLWGKCPPVGMKKKKKKNKEEGRRKKEEEGHAWFLLIQYGYPWV